MNSESLHSERKHRRQIMVACIAVIVSLIAAVAALATVPAARDHLCYEHNVYSFCSGVQISESQLRVFTVHRDALTPRRIRYDIPPEEKRSYISGLPRGTQQWLYWEARLKSCLPPGHSTRFVAYWATSDLRGNPIAGGVVEATWGADNLTAIVAGPTDTNPIRTIGQFPPGRYEIVLKVYGNQLPESEVRGGFDIY